MKNTWLLATAVVAGCASDGTDSSRSLKERSDSAGIQIIENSRPILPDSEAIRLSDSAALVIGSQSGAPYELTRVKAAVRLDDGRIVVANAGTNELRYYDSSGVFLRAAGRRGQGPGEFSGFSEIYHLSGDTLIVRDRDTRYSILSKDGEFVRYATPLRSWIHLPPGLNPFVLAWLDTERAIVANYPADVKPPTTGLSWTDTLTAFYSDPDSSKTTFVGAFPHHMNINRKDRYNFWFAARGRYAATESLFFSGFNNAYSIRVHSMRGNVTRIIRRDVTPVKVTSAHMDMLVAEKTKLWQGSKPEQLQQWIEFLRGDSMAETMPAYAEMIGDRSGRLWVRDANPVEEMISDYIDLMPYYPTRWSVFDRDGRWLCEVSMPARFSPKEIGARYVLGISKTSDDLETVVMYDLVTRTAR